MSSFEVQVKTTPDENVIASSLLKVTIRRESQDARELLVQVYSLLELFPSIFDIHLAEWEARLVELPIWGPSRR